MRYVAKIYLVYASSRRTIHTVAGPRVTWVELVNPLQIILDNQACNGQRGSPSIAAVRLDGNR